MSFTSLELKTKKWIDTLAKLPETAMGCQTVDITLKNGQIMRNIAVSGSTFIFLPVKYKNVTEKDFVKIEMF